MGTLTRIIREELTPAKNMGDPRVHRAFTEAHRSEKPAATEAEPETEGATRRHDGSQATVRTGRPSGRHPR